MTQTSPADQPGHPPLPAPGRPAEPPPERPGRPNGALTLHTDLLGEVVVPNGAAREDALRALAARAATYATRARGGGGTRRVYRSA